MVELFIEVAVGLVWLGVRGIVLALVSLPCGAVAGILAREVLPPAVIWQAIARVGSFALIGLLMGVAVWPPLARAEMWAACVIAGAVVLGGGNIAEYLNHRGVAVERIAGSDGGRNPAATQSPESAADQLPR